jgi:hypothetical protein
MVNEKSGSNRDFTQNGFGGRSPAKEAYRSTYRSGIGRFLIGE